MYIYISIYIYIHIYTYTYAPIFENMCKIMICSFSTGIPEHAMAIMAQRAPTPAAAAPAAASGEHLYIYIYIYKFYHCILKRVSLNYGRGRRSE
jgi:hypothetical protein